MKGKRKREEREKGSEASGEGRREVKGERKREEREQREMIRERREK